MGVWPLEEGGAFYPRDALEWSRTVRDAALLATRLSPRQSSARDVWAARARTAASLLVRKQGNKRGNRGGVGGGKRSGSEEVSSWRTAGFLLRGTLEPLSEDEEHLRVRAAALMHAAALLADGDSCFKRVVSARADEAAAENFFKSASSRSTTATATSAAATSATAASTASSSSKSSSSLSSSSASMAAVDSSAAVSLESSTLKELGAAGADARSLLKIQAMLGDLSPSKAKAKKTTATAATAAIAPPVTTPVAPAAVAPSVTPAVVQPAVSNAGPLVLCGGGWRALVPSVVESREALSFVKAARGKARFGGAALRVAEQLEFLALGGGPVLLGREGARALKELGSPCTAAAAADALVASGHWTRSAAMKATATTAATATGAISASVVTTKEAAQVGQVSPWSAQAIDLAATKALAIGERRKRLASIAAPLPPPSTASANPGFREPGDSVLGGSVKGAWPGWLVGPHGRVDLRDSSLVPLCVDFSPGNDNPAQSLRPLFSHSHAHVLTQSLPRF